MRFLFIVLACSKCLAATLEWADLNDPAGIDGFRVYVGTNAPHAYDRVIDVGHTNSWFITGTQRRATNFFAVTAYGRDGESDFSDEVSWVRRESNLRVVKTDEDEPIEIISSTDYQNWRVEGVIVPNSEEPFRVFKARSPK